MYKDDNYEDLIDNAINEAIANLAMEGFVITDEERKELKEEFLSCLLYTSPSPRD